MSKLRLWTIWVALAFLAAGCAQPQENRIDAYFCPADHCEDRALHEIGAARSTLDIAMYSFTSRELFSGLEEAGRRGVRVRVVADYLQAASPSSVVPWLDGNGVQARAYQKGTTMHNKFAVIDGKTILTGSYNWSTNADERNRENMLIISGTEIAEAYGEEFFRLWTSAD